MSGARSNASIWTGLLWISPWLVGFLAFMALPIVLSLVYSFTDFPLLEGPVFIGLEHYRELLGDPVFGRALLNTVLYTAVSVPLATVVAILVATALRHPVRGAGLYRAAVFVPSIVPVVAAAIVWQWMFNADLGLVNRLLGVVGIRGPAWLAEGPWAMTAIILIGLWGIGPSVVIYLAALRDVPEDLHAAASLDGLGPARRFRHITLPMISPVILFNVIIGLINAWQIFVVPYVMTRGGPDRATYFASMYLYDAAFDYERMGYACAMSWVQLLLVLTVTLIALRASRSLVFYRGATA